MQVMCVCESSLMIHSVQRNRKQGHEQKMKMGDEWVFEVYGQRRRYEMLPGRVGEYKDQGTIV